MNQYSLLKLPEYKVSIVDTGEEHLISTITVAHDWQGRPIGSNYLLTPILYHRGSVLSRAYTDPESTQANFTFPSSVAIRATQYGEGFGVTGDCSRVPRSLLYAGDIRPAATTFSPLPMGGQNASLAYAETIVSGMSANLIRNNVFAACVPSNNSIKNYITFAFPGSSRETWAPFVIDDGKRILDPDRFEGGELLLLYALSVNDSASVGIEGIYYHCTAPPTLIADTQQVDHEITGLAACFPKFKRFKEIVYLRQFYGTASQIALADVLMPAHLALASSLSPYNVILKGPYSATEDITSVIEADIDEFYP